MMALRGAGVRVINVPVDNYNKGELGIGLG